MFAINKIYASGALKKYLDARNDGAPHEVLVKLSEESMAELEADRARMPARRSSLDDVVSDFNKAQAEKR